MSEPFVAEIRIFPYNFAPRGWALCNGQLLPISQNTALFSLVGTVYGGDGRTTLGLPNLQGRAAMHWGNGLGLTWRRLGDTGGSETVTLVDTELPSHTHALMTGGAADTASPAGAAWAAATASSNQPIYGDPATSPAVMVGAFGAAGTRQAHNNMQPYQTLNYCIALQGVYPSRS